MLASALQLVKAGQSGKRKGGKKKASKKARPAAKKKKVAKKKRMKLRLTPAEAKALRSSTRKEMKGLRY